MSTPRHDCKTDDRKRAIDRPCSACSAGDSEMEYHDHCPPFRVEPCQCVCHRVGLFGLMCCPCTRKALNELVNGKPTEPAIPSEGVAAPLEPTRQANELLRTLNREIFNDTIAVEKLPKAVGIVMDWAAAVSKNLQWKLADADQAACTWIKDAELWRKLHQAATEELAEAEYQLGVQKGINQYLRGEITALRETK